MRQPREAGRTIPSCETNSRSAARSRDRDQWTRRVKPQTGHVATLVSASTTRKLVQPFVLQ
jgi:hypothetical protein